MDEAMLKAERNKAVADAEQSEKNADYWQGEAMRLASELASCEGRLSEMYSESSANRLLVEDAKRIAHETRRFRRWVQNWGDQKVRDAWRPAGCALEDARVH